MTISTHTLVLVAMISMFIVFTIIVFWQWISESGIQANQATCTAKLLNYCTRWFGNGFDENKRPDPDWDDIQPENCEEFGITRPDPDQCENLI